MRLDTSWIDFRREIPWNLSNQPHFYRLFSCQVDSSTSNNHSNSVVSTGSAVYMTSSTEESDWMPFGLIFVKWRHGIWLNDWIFRGISKLYTELCNEYTCMKCCIELIDCIYVCLMYFKRFDSNSNGIHAGFKRISCNFNDFKK